MNKRGKTRRLSYGKVIFSLVISILLWSAVTNAWGYSSLIFGSENIYGSFIYNHISRFIWSLMAIVLLKAYSEDIPVKPKELFKNKPDMKPFLITAAAIIAYHIAAMLIYHGGIWINPDMKLFETLSTFVMVAYAEEIVYRGWGMNALSAFVSERKANVISCVFFVILHLPAYVIRLFSGGTISAPAIMTQCAMVFVLGLLFGYLYNKGKSLWSPMAVHFLGDFLSVMMIG